MPSRPPLVVASAIAARCCGSGAGFVPCTPAACGTPARIETPLVPSATAITEAAGEQPDLSVILVVPLPLRRLPPPPLRVAS